MTIQTPEQIAGSALPVYVGDSDMSDGFSKDDMLTFAAAAVHADRAQRDGGAEAGTFFPIGTLVRLTGKDWDEFGIRGEIVSVGVAHVAGRSENTFTHEARGATE